MAYDIYGQVLKPGYCEVHPFIAQPYPCDVCIIESGHATTTDPESEAR